MELISRKAMLESLEKHCDMWDKDLTGDLYHSSEVRAMINEVPTVEAYTFEEVEKIRQATIEQVRNSCKNETPHGKWIVDEEHSITMTFYKCTNCDYFGGATHYRYCPRCGADMRGGSQ